MLCHCVGHLRPLQLHAERLGRLEPLLRRRLRRVDRLNCLTHVLLLGRPLLLDRLLLSPGGRSLLFQLGQLPLAGIKERRAIRWQ